MPKKRKQKSRSFSGKAPAPIVNIAERRSVRKALQSNRKEGIFLAVPSVSGRTHYTIPVAFAQAMASSNLAECPYRFAVHVEAGRRPADHARNTIVKKFLQSTDFDWLVMIDEDQGVPENWWQLCAVTDADIVSGLTPVWVGNQSQEAMLRPNHYGLNREGHCFNLQFPADSVKQPYRVPIVGTGCIAIRRRVFAPPPAGLGVSPFYFTFQKDRQIMAGEDVNFSVDANKLGFTIAVHPGVLFDHCKEIPLWQVEQYYQARHKMEAEGRVTTDQQRLSIG